MKEKLLEEIKKNYSLDVGRLIPVKSFRQNLFQLTNANGDRYFVRVYMHDDLPKVRLITSLSDFINTDTNFCADRYIKTNEGSSFVESDSMERIATIAKWQDMKKVEIGTKGDVVDIGKNIAMFHKMIKEFVSGDLLASDFHNDFMTEDVVGLQSSDRLKVINSFYQDHSPDYNKLTMGIIHNDMHLDNLGVVGAKIYITDFEHVKSGPLISDIGVLALDLWPDNSGIQSYFDMTRCFLSGYEEVVQLTDYDKREIVKFSIRYLYSDENWFNYWQKKTGKNLRGEIEYVQNRVKILMQLIS